jgi:hypothetical protein
VEEVDTDRLGSDLNELTREANLRFTSEPNKANLLEVEGPAAADEEEILPNTPPVLAPLLAP